MGWMRNCCRECGMPLPNNREAVFRIVRPHRPTEEQLAKTLGIYEEPHGWTEAEVAATLGVKHG